MQSHYWKFIAKRGRLECQMKFTCSLFNCFLVPCLLFRCLTFLGSGDNEIISTDNNIFAASRTYNG